ncbi:MAG: aspartate-semialdehyde dehydrogenase [Candidatus Dadabacteria bacterium]|nr:MAG: aspartate-semialdehyde dehydrogenase [Candidatus Dadabacteria bacterium]
MALEPAVGIAGATGLVGNEMLVVLEQLDVRCKILRLFASKDSVGELYSFFGDEVEVEELNDDSFEGLDFVLFATSAELSEKYVPLAVEAGAVAIDNSSHFRMHENVPLVVPEVNIEAVTAEDKIIANPNCSTIQLVPLLKVIDELAGLKRVVVSTYQSVSGAGKAALDELWAQTRAVFTQQEMPHDVFHNQIAFNCIPQIDILQDDGYTREEHKIINESRKILSLPDLKITATAVRVPVFHSHAESVNVETREPLTPQVLIESLEKRDCFDVYPDFHEYPMQLGVTGSDSIHVGRIRRDLSVANGLDMWIVADNIRKGAALNAVQILKALIEREVFG